MLYAQETKLFNCKVFQLQNIRNVMGRRSDMEKETLVYEAWQMKEWGIEGLAIMRSNGIG